MYYFLSIKINKSIVLLVGMEKSKSIRKIKKTTTFFIKFFYFIVLKSYLNVISDENEKLCNMCKLIKAKQLIVHKCNVY